MRNSAATLCIPLIWVMLISCGRKSSEEESRTLPDTLKVAVELSTLTLSTSGDTISGFSLELLQHICEEHGLPISYVPFNNIEHALNQANQNNFHVFVSNVPVTKETREKYLVTVPLYTDRQILVQNLQLGGDSLINSPHDMEGRPVWIPARNAINERMENLGNETGVDILAIPVDDITEEQLVILVSLGEIPRAVASESIARSLADRYPHIDINTSVSFNQFRSWFLNHKDSVLCDSLNNWIVDFKATPEYETLSGKYHITSRI